MAFAFRSGVASLIHFWQRGIYSESAYVIGLSLLLLLYLVKVEQRNTRVCPFSRGSPRV
jgi:hypothetical protein